MRRFLFALAAISTIVIISGDSTRPDRAEASFHIAEISELMLGWNGDNAVQYVEITQRGADQNQVAGTTLVLVSDGTILRVPANVPNDGDGTTWLMGTHAFETASGIEVDFEFSPMLPGSVSGMICWGAVVNVQNPNEHVDCLGYASYGGPAVPSAPASELIGGNLCDMSLTRTVPATFDANTPPLDTWADGNNANDFAFAAPSPTNNAGQTGVLTPTNTDGDALVDCAEDDDDDDLVEDFFDNCPLVSNAGQDDGDGDDAGDACDPFSVDGDGDDDGCSDGEELGTNITAGGRRDPANPYDFFDVTGDRSVDLNDSLRILSHFGHAPSADAQDDKLDRFIPDTDYRWRSAAADSGVDLFDVLVQLRQYGAACEGP